MVSLIDLKCVTKIFVPNQRIRKGVVSSQLLASDLFVESSPGSLLVQVILANRRISYGSVFSLWRFAKFPMKCSKGISK